MSSVEGCAVYQRLVQTKTSKQILDGISRLTQVLATKLGRIDLIFNDYTGHDISHASRVLINFCKIATDAKIVKEMNQEQAMIALCACLLHDIGMGPINSEEIARTLAPSGPNFSEKEKETIRKTHHERTATWIRSYPEELSWFPQELIEPLALVARAHRQVMLHSEAFPDNPPDLAFIAGVLRLADQMDLSPERATWMGVTEQVLSKIKDLRQRKEMLKSFAEKQWELQPLKGEKAIILQSKLVIDEWTIEILDALNELVEEIELTIEETKDLLWRNRAVLPARLETKFSVVEQISSQHGIRVNYPQIWHYLNERLYPKEIRDYVSIREAISNAIDACQMLLPEEREEACVRIRDEGERLVFTDTGIGMTPEIIEHYLKVLGSSYYHSRRFRKFCEAREMESPSHIGEFGLGIFTYFLLTDSFELITSPELGGTYRIYFSGRYGVSTKINQSDLPRGTRLILPCPARPEIWSDAEKLRSIVNILFPRPRVKTYFEENERVSPVGLLWQKPHKCTIRDNKGLIEFSFAKEKRTRGFRIGYTGKGKYLAAKRFSIIDNALSIKQLYDALREAHRRLQRVGWQQNIMMLYEGMFITKGGIPTTPFVSGLLSSLVSPIYLEKILTAQFEESPIELGSGPSYKSSYPIKPEAYAWVDFPAGSIELDLTKMKVEQTDTFSRKLWNAVVKLDQLAINPCITLLSSNQIPTWVQERMRYEILHKMTSSYDTRELVRRQIQTKHYLTEEMLKSVIYPLIGLEPRKKKYLKFEDLLQLPKKSPIIIVQGMEDQDLRTKSDISFLYRHLSARAKWVKDVKQRKATVFAPVVSYGIIIEILLFILKRMGFENVHLSQFQIEQLILQDLL